MAEELPPAAYALPDGMGSGQQSSSVIILLPPPLPSAGVSTGMQRECQQHDRTENSRHPLAKALMIQFGFMTLFAVGLPLAPAFAFISNAVELRLDAQNLCKYVATAYVWLKH